MTTEQCSICLEEFTEVEWRRECSGEAEGRNAVKCTKCEARYHPDCLITWLNDPDAGNFNTCPICRVPNPILHPGSSRYTRYVVFQRVFDSLADPIREQHDAAYQVLNKLALEKEASKERVVDGLVSAEIRDQLSEAMRPYADSMKLLMETALHKSVHPVVPWATRDTHPAWQQLDIPRLLKNVERAANQDHYTKDFYREVRKHREARIFALFTADEGRYNESAKDYVRGKAKAEARLHANDTKNFPFAEANPIVMEDVLHRFHDDSWAPWACREVRKSVGFEICDLEIARNLKARVMPRVDLIDELKELYDATARATLHSAKQRPVTRSVAAAAAAAALADAAAAGSAAEAKRARR